MWLSYNEYRNPSERVLKPTIKGKEANNMTKTTYSVEQKLDTETITKALAAMTPEQKQLIGGLIIGMQLAGQMNRKEAQ